MALYIVKRPFEGALASPGDSGCARRGEMRRAEAGTRDNQQREEAF